MKSPNLTVLKLIWITITQFPELSRMFISVHILRLSIVIRSLTLPLCKNKILRLPEVRVKRDKMASKASGSSFLSTCLRLYLWHHLLPCLLPLYLQLPPQLILTQLSHFYETLSTPFSSELSELVLLKLRFLRIQRQNP